MTISKIIIPAAGLGTRFLPFTKTIPKELLPLIDKPALQHIIEEGHAAGVTHFCLIINDQKDAIKDYFTINPTLNALLEQKGRLDRIAALNQLIESTQFEYIDQPIMRGLGHAILMAKEHVGVDAFGVMLPDDIIVSEQPAIGQLMAVAQEYNAMVIAVKEVPSDQISAYGSIKPGKKITDSIVAIDDIIEKPKPGQEFSNLGIIGRYIFTPEIFDAIETIALRTNNEIQLTDAIAHLAKSGHRVLAYKVAGKRFDLGRPPGWLAANIYFGTHSSQYGDAVRRILN